MTTGRIYIYFGKDYYDYNDFRDFDDLIAAVAFSNSYANGKFLVKKEGKKEIICEGNTKAYIASEATRLIRAINPIYGEHHMGLHASKRQFNELIKVCNHKGRSLSCYSLVMLHIIYINIKKSERGCCNHNLNKLNSLIHQIAQEVYRLNHDNVLAQYLIDCHPIINKEINNGIIPVVNDFPATRRWY